MLKAIVTKTIEFCDQKVFRSPSIPFLLSLFFTVYFLITDKYTIWIRLLPFIILCLILLALVAYFLWHETPANERVTLSRFRSRIAGLLLQRYVKSGLLVIILSIACLAVTYTIIKCLGVGEMEKQEVQLYTKGKDDKPLRNIVTIDPLTAFDPYEFLENSKEFAGYLPSTKR